MRVAPRCVLGMDLGTSSLKCVIMDASGDVLATSERSYPTQSLHPGWAEQNPEDWVVAMREAIADLRKTAPQYIPAIETIGLCSAAHIPVLLDEQDEVIRPAILWSDQRSVQEVADLKVHYGSFLEEVTLNEAGCTWTLPQLLWIRNQEPALMKQVRHFLSSKDYLVFRLTGCFSMDYASATATLMFDVKKKAWSNTLSVLAGLADDVLPPLFDPTEVVGRISRESADFFGLPEGVPVISGTLDSAAEMLGCGILNPGELGMVRLGSAGGIMVVTERPACNKGIITYPHVVDGVFYKQAGTNACATSLKWIRKLCMNMRGNDAPELTYEKLDQIAAEARPGSDGLMFHPYIQGERSPWWNSELRGSFTGIDYRHDWPQFVRAVMEGVAFSLLDCLNMFRHDGYDMKAGIMSGGVVKSPLWSQIITDVLGMETGTVCNGDSALGACMLAATSAGLFSSVNEAVSICLRKERVMLPDHANHELYGRMFLRYRETGSFFDAMQRKQIADSVRVQ